MTFLCNGAIFVLASVAPLLAAAQGITPCPKTYCVLQNDYFRFGSGSEHSMNGYGLMSLPYYRSGGDGYFYMLALYQNLCMAVGTGTTSTHWTTASVIDIYNLQPSLTVDYSGFVVTSGNIGYGTIVSENSVLVNGQPMRIRNAVTLGENSDTFETVTTITNTGSAPMTNVWVWAGVGDNFFYLFDGTLLARGNIVGGEFTTIATSNEPSSAVKISLDSVSDVAYLYSSDSGAKSVIGNSFGFSNAFNLNPAYSYVQSSFYVDRSYAVLKKFGDLAAGASSTFTYYLKIEPAFPSGQPSGQPSKEPTGQPSGQPSKEPTGQPSSQPTGPIQGSWCVDIGLFDSFGNGWGEGVVLRISDSNNLMAYLDISNPDTAFVETQLCLDPSLELRTEVTCDHCELLEPWEMYYTISETKGKNPKSYLGAYNTVMSLHRKDISVIRNKIDYKDDRRSCPDDKCSGGRGDRYADKVIDMTGEGWCSNSRHESKVPEYDATGSKIVGYSSNKLPESLTAPDFVISTGDRTQVVLRGTLSADSSGRRGRKKKSDKVSYGAIFCGKDKSLPDGSYVFRIDGALSRTHTHKDTKWELCGYRGNSAEELQFTMRNGVCIPTRKRSRWEMSGAQSLAIFTASLRMQFDDPSTLQALDDVSYNEVFLDELESALLVGMSSINSSSLVVGASVNSILIHEGVIQASIGLRINTAMYGDKASLSQDASNTQIAMALQEQLASPTCLAAIVDDLHKYPEFGAVSSVTISSVAYDRNFEVSSHVAPQEAAQAQDMNRASGFNLSAAYLSVGILGMAVLGVVAMRRYT